MLCFELLLVYIEKAVLDHFKESSEYGVLLNNMALCYSDARRWSDCLLLLQEAVEHDRVVHGSYHPESATTLVNLAVLYGRLKQFEEAIPRYEEAFSIYTHVFGRQHPRTLAVHKDLMAVRAVLDTDRNIVDVGHDHRMCNNCGTIRDTLLHCPCARAWYCNPECQKKHWGAHKPHCNTCAHCGKVLPVILVCGHCKIVKYCNAECSKLHWNQHKVDCVK